MTRARGAAILSLILTWLAAAPVAQETAFRTGVETVVLYATVRGADGRLIPDLSAGAFEVLEDGRPVDVSVFSREAEPLNIAIMLDTSASMPGWRDGTVRAAVLALLDALAPADRASIGTFGLEIAVGANLTNDRREHLRVLDEEVWTGGGSPVWEALRAAMSSLEGQSGRRVVLAVTDGQDTGGVPGFDGGRSGAERQAVESACIVYAVGFETVARDSLSGGIARLTESTGGGHAGVPRGGNLSGTMTRIAEELRHQYLIGFVPRATDGRVHRVEVRLKQPGLRATTRTSFVAPVRR